MAFTVLSPLHRATRQVTLWLEHQAAQRGLDLRADEGHALTYITAYAPCPTGDIQRVLGVSRSTLTSLLDRLCRRQLVERQPDPQDKRVLLLKPTPAGKRLAQRMVAVGQELESQVLAQISGRDQAAFTRVMTAIAAATGVTVVDRGASHSKDER